MNPRTLHNLEKTIAFCSREIRRSGELDAKSVSALAKLCKAYSNLMQGEEEHDPFLDGDPFHHDSLQGPTYIERKRQREREATEKAAQELGLNLDELEDEDEDENGEEDD